MFYHFATDLLWVVLLEAWGNVEQATRRNWRKTPTHRKGMEKWSKVKSNTHRERPILGHSFYRQLKGGWEGTISQPLVGCLLLERIRMPALHRWLTTEHRGEEGGKEFPLGCYISDPALLTANSGGGGTFGRKRPPLGSGGVRMVPRGRASLAPQSPSFFPLHPRGGDSTSSPASSWVRAAEGGHEPGLQQGPFRLHSHPWALGSPEFPHSLRQEGRHGHLICPGRWLTTDKQQLPHPHWGHLPDCPPWNQADKGRSLPASGAPTGLPAEAQCLQWGLPAELTLTELPDVTKERQSLRGTGPQLSSTWQFYSTLLQTLSHITLITTREDLRAGVFVSILQMSKQLQDVW